MQTAPGSATPRKRIKSDFLFYSILVGLTLPLLLASLLLGLFRFIAPAIAIIIISLVGIRKNGSSPPTSRRYPRTAHWRAPCQ